MADELIKAGSGLPAPQMNVTASKGATAIGQVVGDVRLEMGPELEQQPRAQRHNVPLGPPSISIISRKTAIYSRKNFTPAGAETPLEDAP